MSPINDDSHLTDDVLTVRDEDILETRLDEGIAVADEDILQSCSLPPPPPGSPARLNYEIDRVFNRWFDHARTNPCFRNPLAAL